MPLYVFEAEPDGRSINDHGELFILLEDYFVILFLGVAHQKVSEKFSVAKLDHDMVTCSIGLAYII